MGTETLAEKLERVSNRVKAKPMPIDAPAPKGYRPHPSVLYKDLGMATRENAVLWQLVDAYEATLRFLSDDPMVARTLERGAAMKKSIS